MSANGNFMGFGGLAVDGTGNIYGVQSSVVSAPVLFEIPTGCQVGTYPGTGSCTVSTLGNSSLFGTNTTEAIAVDGAGNAYVTSFNAVNKIPAGCTTANYGISCTATALGGSFVYVNAISVDGGGNVYVVADNALQEIPSGCTDSSCVIYLHDSILSSPNMANGFNGVALDATGNVYISQQSNSVDMNLVYKLTRAVSNGVPFTANMTFSPTAAGTKSAVQFASLQNIGTSALTFSPAPLSATGSNPNVTAPFAMDNTSTVCATPSALAPSATCSLAFNFTPTAVGLATGSATVTDNSLNVTGATQIVPMSGTGVVIGISPASPLPNGTIGMTYSQTLTANGDANATAPYILSLSSGTLPTGLYFNPQYNGVIISGTPTAAGTYNFVITVKDSSSVPFTVSVPYTIMISSDLRAVVTVSDKTYDGTTAATITGCTLQGTIAAGDTVNCNTSAASVVFADANAGTNKPLSSTGVTLGGASASKYTLSNITVTNAAITPRAMTVSAIAENKPYDGTTKATITGCGVSTAAGLLTADLSYVSCSSSAAVGTFADATVGNGKTVTVTGITLTGTKAGNYSITTPVTTTANITEVPTPADYKITFTTTSGNVPASGGSATYSISVTSLNGVYSNAVPLAVSGLPIGATSNSLAPVTPGASGATSSLIVTVPKATTTTCNASVRTYSPYAIALLLLPVMLIGKARKLRLGSLLLVVLMFGAIAGVVGCGRGGGDTKPPCSPTTTNAVQAGTYTITITGNDANHKATATLVVQ